MTEKGSTTAKFLKPENLVVGLFGLLVTIAGFDAERMIQAQKDTNDRLGILADQLGEMKVTQAALAARVTANEDRITSNRVYIAMVDNRVRDLEIGGRNARKTEFIVPPAPPPIQKIVYDKSADRTRTSRAVVHLQQISTSLNVKRP